VNAKSVLVIEDNELNMKLIRTLLQLRGYHVLEAVDAETGIELSRKEKSDLILMDIQLPGMNGLEATRLIKENSATKKVPVVALSSYAMNGDKEKAIEAGCIDYITKPIDTKRFLEKLEKYLA
jgi:CheY-like chemotaxis protein